MELLLASWLNPTQLGRLREAGRSISLDEVTDVATSGFRSMGTREDTLVFALGLLNLGTVLCYAIYAQLFKPALRHGQHPMMDDPQFLYKKVQNIMDELVLHVQTATYYKRVTEESSSSNALRARRGHPSSVRKGSSSSSTFNFFTGNHPDQDYQTYLKGRIKEMAREWMSVLPELATNVMPSGKRITKREAPSRPRMMRRRFRSNGTLPVHHGGIDSSGPSAEWKTGAVSRSGSSISRADRQPQAIRRPLARSPEADGTVAGEAQQKEQQQTDIPGRRVPVRSASRPVFSRSEDTVTGGQLREDDDDEIRSGNRNKELRIDANVPRRHRQEFEVQQPAPSVSAPPHPIKIHSQHQEAEEQQQHRRPEEPSFLGRLMGLIQQTTPITMDVLGVYDKVQGGRVDGHSKCLERLLCQLNQDWKNHGGAVPAALAPFLSISTGWWMDDGAGLPHILMATRAGWIGKHCSSLYPQCHSPGRARWTVTTTTNDAAVPSGAEDSINLPSVSQSPIKVRPPAEYFTTTTTTRPVLSSSTSAPLPSSSPRSVPPSSIKSTTRVTTTTTTTPAPTTTSTTAASIDREGQNEDDDEEGEEEEGGSDSSGQQSPGSKPWGKPTRFGIPDGVPLSDIVRGIYATSEEYEEDEDDEEDEEDEEEDEEEEDEEANTDGHSIFHDLKKHHFSTTGKPYRAFVSTTTSKPVMSEAAYQELQKKKKERLEMVPSRGLVHPWLSEPVWAPENPYPLRPDNHLRNYEDEGDEQTMDRHRDKVSFLHEDAVKDTRLYEFAMQYLRDRSA